MKIAVITARGGSKRIPRKNIRPFCGKPMIAWPIEAAKASHCFDHILVSTDDLEIADVAKAWGAEVPYLRPVALADDHTPAHKAAREMLEWSIGQYGEIPAFCHLYPTAPLLKADVIKQGMRLVLEDKFGFAMTVTRLNFPLYQLLEQKADGGLSPIFSMDKFMMRSQDMPSAYVDAGQAYFFKTARFLACETAIADDMAPVVLPSEVAWDIDTEEDWGCAEKMFSLLNGTRIEAIEKRCISSDCIGK
jgi:pseudaminic acid cytidylyltransferase